MLKSHSFFCFAAAMSCCLAGCNSGTFPTEKVTGKVTCDGQPVSNALVYLEPIRTSNTSLVGQQGHGLTDANGVFKITTYNDGDGAVLGKHKLRVGKTESSPPCNCGLNANTVLQEIEVKRGSPNDFTVVLPAPAEVPESVETPVMTDEQIEKAMDAAQ